MLLDIRVLNGFPITVRADVIVKRLYGFRSHRVSDWAITHINGRKLRKPPFWLYKRIEESGENVAALIETELENF